MRRPSIFIHRREEVDVKMTPMIDVVFLLLVFFVWTASFQIVEHVLPSQLSAATGAQPADPSDPPPPRDDFDDVVIRILWSENRPGWQINDVPLDSLDQVRSYLDKIAAIKQDAPVILHPDREVPLGHVIDVYDLARLVGFQQVRFAASEEVAAGSPGGPGP